MDPVEKIALDLRGVQQAQATSQSALKCKHRARVQYEREPTVIMSPSSSSMYFKVACGWTEIVASYSRALIQTVPSWYKLGGNAAKRLSLTGLPRRRKLWTRNRGSICVESYFFKGSDASKNRKKACKSSHHKAVL